MLLGVSEGSLGALLTSLGSLLVLVGLSRWFWGAFGVSSFCLYFYFYFFKVCQKPKE